MHLYCPSLGQTLPSPDLGGRSQQYGIQFHLRAHHSRERELSARGGPLESFKVSALNFKDFSGVVSHRKPPLTFSPSLNLDEIFLLSVPIVPDAWFCHQALRLDYNGLPSLLG